MRKLLAATVLVALLCAPIQSDAQVGANIFSPCAPNSLSVSGTSSNVQLSVCGPVVYLINTTSQEAFWKLGPASTTAATTTVTDSYSIPGNTYERITVPTGQSAGYYLAAITATGTTTIRILQGVQ